MNIAFLHGDNYVLGDVISEGSEGMVFIAHDATYEPVAIKVFAEN